MAPVPKTEGPNPQGPTTDRSPAHQVSPLRFQALTSAQRWELKSGIEVDFSHENNAQVSWMVVEAIYHEY